MQADRSCEKRMDELARRAARTGIAQVTSFLTPSEVIQAGISAGKEGVRLQTWGGVANAERCLAAFCIDEEELDWPIAMLLLQWNVRYGSISHRDILGSLMALGMDRGKYGDIYVYPGKAYVAAQKEIAGYVSEALDRVGNVSVRVHSEAGAIDTPVGDGESMCCTVASLRIDAVIAAAWKLSRTDAQALVRAAKVQVDYRQELRPERIMKENMVISVRGRGRVTLMETIGKTKKDRIRVMLMRF